MKSEVEKLNLYEEAFRLLDRAKELLNSIIDDLEERAIRGEPVLKEGESLDRSPMYHPDYEFMVYMHEKHPSLPVWNENAGG